MASRGRRNGTQAERWAADNWDLEVVAGQDPEWVDAVNPRTGAKYQIKSCVREQSNGRPGRFRLWENQHESLVASDARGTAWYVFVLRDGGDVDEWRRLRPKTVTGMIDGWNQAGHRKREGRQKKIPWHWVIDA